MRLYFKDGQPVVVPDWHDRVAQVLMDGWPGRASARVIKALRRRHPLRAERILIFSNLHLGDGIIQSPQIKLVREKFPDAEIGVVASRRNQEIFLHNPFVDHIVLFPDFLLHRLQVLNRLPLVKQLRLFLRFARAIYRADLCILNVWQHGLRSKILTRFLGARYIVSETCQSPQGRALVDEAVSVDAGAHFVEQHLQIVQRSTLGSIPVESVDSQPVVYLSDAEIRRAKERCGRIGLEREGIWIGVHMGAAATGRTKLWGAARYFELLSMVADSYPSAQFLLFRGPDERELDLGPFRSLNCYVVEDLSFLECVAILREADLFIGNDSSFGHAAAAFKVPVVSIFGPTSDNHYRPYGEDVSVVRSATGHPPCHEDKSYYRHCAGRVDCLRSLAADAVFAVVDERIRRLA
jgi:ADP-heptose:LPS heptosyltransferase